MSSLSISSNYGNIPARYQFQRSSFTVDTGSELGTGGFGTVHRVTLTEGAHSVVVAGKVYHAYNPAIALEEFEKLLQLQHHSIKVSALHLDVKPANVLVVDYGHRGLVAKLSDLGSCRVSATTRSTLAFTNATAQSLAGTPRYMAPEQWDPEFGKLTTKPTCMPCV